MSSNPSRNSAKNGADVRLQIAQPFSLQAEQAIIGSLLSDPIETHHQIGESLMDTHFYDPFCRAVFQKSMELLGTGSTIDAVVLAARLEGVVDLTQAEILSSLEQIFMSYPAVSNANGWADVIVDKYVERSLSKTGIALAEMAHAQNVPRADKLAAAHQMLSDVGKTMATDTIVTLPEMLIATMAMVQENSQRGGKIAGVPSGFDELDELLSGFSPGDLVVLGARPSMGKTAAALSIAKYCSSELPKEERKGVLMFSLEMGATQIGLRWFAVRHQINIKHMRSGRVSQAENEAMKRGLEEADEYPFFLEESGSLKIEQLAAKARKKHAEYPLGLIIIDYLQLIEDSGRAGANKAERVGEISRALKQLAKELGVPIIALSQLSRELEKRADKRPIMSDLRESGAIEQDADIVMFVYRDEVYNPGTTDRGIAEFIIAKQRNGGLGTVRLGYVPELTCFRNLTATPTPF